MESVPAETPDTVHLDVQHNSGGVCIAVQDCPLDDDTSLALWEAFSSERSISAPASDNPIPPPSLEADGPNLPLHTIDLFPGGPDMDMVLRDRSPFEEGDRVQQPQPIDDRERNSASSTVIESSPAGQEDTSRAALDISANTAPSECSPPDQAHSSRSADTADAADTEGSDSDPPPLARRRRRMRLHTRRSNSPSPPLTPRSSAHSTEAESTTPLYRRKRLGRRTVMRRHSPTPETDESSTSLTTSMSSKGRGGRWPVQCFVERKTIGSREVIMIELPVLDVCARSGYVSILAPSNDTSQKMPILGAARRGRRRSRFSQAEEDLLVKLKEQREPRLTWMEIQRHFPDRTIGSLQVHYSTHLKGRRAPEQRAGRHL
jgi:hypothetical protein